MSTDWATKEHRWVLSIHDRLPNGLLAFDLKEVIESLGGTIGEYTWLFDDLETSGDRVSTGRLLSTPELVQASEGFIQTINASLVGFCRRESAEKYSQYLSRMKAPPPYAPDLLIMAIDSSYFDVIGRDQVMADMLQQRFKDVRKGDITNY